MTALVTKSNQPSKESERASSIELPFLKIPNGFPPEDEISRDLWTEAASHLSEEQLATFFTDEVLTQRLMICPVMLRDPTDCWGIFGTEPGFIFIQKGVRFDREARTLAEDLWASGKSVRLARTNSGLEIAVIGEGIVMPRCKEILYQEVRGSEHPNAFKFLCKRLFEDGKYPEIVSLAAMLEERVTLPALPVESRSDS